MFLKHALSFAVCSSMVLSSMAFSADKSALKADEPCLIAGWENPASVCSAHNRTLAATCFNCHGPNGHSNSAIPGLAGQDKHYIVTAMKEFRDGKRESTVMQKYAMGYTDAEYEAIAALFTSSPVTLAQKQGDKK